MTNRPGKKKSHDSFFKSVLENFPGEFLSLYFEGLVERRGGILDVEFLREEASKADFRESKLIMDGVARYRFREGKALLVLCEFESDRSAFSVGRLCRYVCKPAERRPGEEILPVALFTDSKRKPRREPKKEMRVEADGRTWLYFTYRGIRLMDSKSGDFVGSDNPVANIFATRMDHEPEEKTGIYAQALKRLEAAVSPELLRKYFEWLMDYLSEFPRQHEELCQLIEKEQVMKSPFIQKLQREGFQLGKREGIDEGIQQGIQLGKREGIQLGKREHLLSLMKIKFRFDEIPPPYAEKVRRLDEKSFDDVLRRIFDARSPDELFD